MELPVFESVLVKCIIFIELVLGEAAMTAQDAIAPVPVELLGGAQASLCITPSLSVPNYRKPERETLTRPSRGTGVTRTHQ